MKKSTVAIIASIAASALGACGSRDDSASVSANLIVASLASSTSVNLNSVKPMEMSFTQVPKSSTNFSFAKMDGIKVTIHQVRGADQKSDNPLTTNTIDKEITLTDNPTDVISLDETQSWTVGDYSGVDLLVENNFKVKSYCKTAYNSGTGAYTLVYTTASGISTTSCASDGACSTMPTDYDYYAYSELDPYYTNNTSNPYPFLQTHFKFSIAAGSTPKIQLLFDATNTVACWDGSGVTGSEDDTTFHAIPMIGAFKSPSTASEFVARWSGAAMAVPVLPVIAYVTTDTSEEAPTARTFFSSSTQSDLSSLADNIASTETLTVLYNASGTPISAGVRNSIGTSSVFKDVVEGFSANATAGWDFFSSGWYWDGTSNPPEFVRNRELTGFNPPGDYTTVFSATVADGPDCGLTKIDQNGNNSSVSCLGNGITATQYFLEAYR